jgi:decarbamoylnovobiocin carbamoyltransferase/7-O-carbamoyltransferase
MRTASVGPGLGSDAEIERELASWGDVIEYERPADVIESAARSLADGAVIGWAQGRSEYGPRALGNRSILADARPGGNKDRINAMVKKREAYRPFAPAVTAEAATRYFDLPDTVANYEFMSFVVDVRPERRAELEAVTHVDGSARVQIVDAAVSRRFHRLIQRFGDLTGTPVLLNTSFNNYAEPIVQTVRDALTCYLTTELDILFVEDFLIRRRPGPPRPFGGLVVHLRSVARLAKRIRTIRTGVRETCYEIYLEHPGGSHAEVTDRVFAMLEVADGTRTLDELAAATGVLVEKVMEELYGLWQQRFFHLLPRA